MIIIIVSFIIKTEHSDKSISWEMSTKTEHRQERKTAFNQIILTEYDRVCIIEDDVKMTSFVVWFSSE